MRLRRKAREGNLCILCVQDASVSQCPHAYHDVKAQLQTRRLRMMTTPVCSKTTLACWKTTTTMKKKMRMKRCLKIRRLLHDPLQIWVGGGVGRRWGGACGCGACSPLTGTWLLPWYTAPCTRGDKSDTGHSPCSSWQFHGPSGIFDKVRNNKRLKQILLILSTLVESREDTENFGRGILVISKTRNQFCSQVYRLLHIADMLVLEFDASFWLCLNLLLTSVAANVWLLEQKCKEANTKKIIHMFEHTHTHSASALGTSLGSSFPLGTCRA